MVAGGGVVVVDAAVVAGTLVRVVELDVDVAWTVDAEGDEDAAVDDGWVVGRPTPTDLPPPEQPATRTPARASRARVRRTTGDATAALRRPTRDPTSRERRPTRDPGSPGAVRR